MLLQIFFTGDGDIRNEDKSTSCRRDLRLSGRLYCCFSIDFGNWSLFFAARDFFKAFNGLSCLSLVRSTFIRHPARVDRPAVHQRMEPGAAQAAHHRSGREGKFRAAIEAQKGK